MHRFRLLGFYVAGIVAAVGLTIGGVSTWGTADDHGAPEASAEETVVASSVRGDRGHPLSEQKIHQWIESLKQLDDDDIIRPIERGRVAVYRYSPDEITKLTPFYESMAA